MERCPNCGLIDIGKIGPKRYYCAECATEFQTAPAGVKMFRYGEEGELEEELAYV